MAVVAFTSLAGTAGVTATALAAAVHWPRPVLAMEADTSNVGTAMTGFFRGNLRSNAGMHQVALAHTRNALSIDALLDTRYDISIAVHELPQLPQMPIPGIPTGHRLWVIPGFRDLQAAQGTVGIWPRLPALFEALDERGIDVLLDLGRLAVNDKRLILLDSADQVVIVAATTMNDLNRLVRRLHIDDLKDRVEGLGATKFSALLTRAPFEAVATSYFGQILPVLGLVDHDPEGSAVFALGHEDRKPARNRFRAGIRAAVNALTERLEHTTPSRKAG